MSNFALNNTDVLKTGKQMWMPHMNEHLKFKG